MTNMIAETGDFTCPNCFTVNIVVDDELIGYCHACFSFTGLTPWVPADGDGKCELCSRPNAVWWVQSEIWNAVMGSEGGVLCPNCFLYRARVAGVGRRGAWQLYPPAS